MTVRVGGVVRPVIVGFWELSVILSCHANFIKFIMALHTFWCASSLPEREGVAKRQRRRGLCARSEHEDEKHPWEFVHESAIVALGTSSQQQQRQYLVHLPEAVGSQSVVVAPYEWSVVVLSGLILPLPFGSSNEKTPPVKWYPARVDRNKSSSVPNCDTWTTIKDNSAKCWWQVPHPP